MLILSMLILSIIALLYLGVLAWMYVNQRKLIYDPVTQIDSPDSYGLSGIDIVELLADDGSHPVAWIRPAKAGFPTIVYFHGNSGHIGDRVEKLRALGEQGFGLLAVSYRGYGKSAGIPSERGIYSDARATVRYALDVLCLPPQKVLLYGESLGSGVAVQIAMEFPDIGGLVLEAPYLSVAKRGMEKYPYIPVTLLLKDKFESIKKIKQVKSPLLIMHGEIDAMIPVRHGRTLLAAANAPKEGVFYKKIGHTDFDLATLVGRVSSFAKRRGLIEDQPL